VGRITGIVQNEPIDSGYDPLLAYDGRWAWPEAPIEARLKHHPALPLRAEFLYESPWTAPKDAKTFELLADNAFDTCILAVPVGALSPMCDDIANKLPAWRTMLETSSTTPTLSAQLWQSRTTSELGWPNGQTVLTANRAPLSTWSDMSFLLKIEQPSSSEHLSYFCGPYPRKPYTNPPPVDFSEQELARGIASTSRWMNDNLGELMPKAAAPTSFAPAPGGDELYVRVNSFPSDGYVLTRPGSVRNRLAPGDSGVANLYLAGDWTKNGFDIGSFETAVVSGLLCAKAIAGTRVRVPGESDRVV
jgi:uncharacterized protein with NAD-binding domain and iron-sulfur cluster